MSGSTEPIHHGYIDALRGYAILGVIVVHVGSAVPIGVPMAQTYINQGARGVQLFYVASAYTLLLSWHARKDGVLPYLVRRFFRIAPLFWLAIPLYALFSGMGTGFFAPPDNWKLWDVFRALTFMDAIYPAAFSMVPGGFTITAEILF
jgi:exopolysaccharide production protein ExoZ